MSVWPMSPHRRSRARDAIDDVRTAILLARVVLRLRAGHAPWHSRSRARVRRLTPSRLGR
jgi:hypothetical protein